MTLYAEMGRGNEIRRLYRRLETVLANDLDAEPEEQTFHLMKSLLDELSQKPSIREREDHEPSTPEANVRRALF